MRPTHKLTAASIIAGGMLVTGTALATTDIWADERAAAEEALTGQRTLGYDPCQPTLVELGDVKGAAAWAAWPEEYGRCEIGIAPDSDTWGPDFTTYVMWHEVCHLSTGHGIASDLHTNRLPDLYHVAQAFKDCMAGLPAPPPRQPNQVQFEVQDGQGDSHIVTTDTDSLNPGDSEYEAGLCADLQATKPWIDWGCDTPEPTQELEVGEDGYMQCSPNVRITKSECEAND